MKVRPWIKNKKKLSVKLSVLFFSRQSVSMTEVRLHDWSDTPLKAWLGHAAAHLRASTPAAGPCQQATADWLTAEMGRFLYPKLSFWRPRGSILVSWGTIVVIQGSTGTPNRHLEVQVSIFSDFRMHFGGLLGLTLETFLWFFSDLGCQSGKQFLGPCFWWSRDGNDARMQWLYVL